MYQPEQLAEPAGSVAADLATHAWNGRLTVYAGAGVSAAPPTSLPGADALARLVADALRAQIPLDRVNCDDLIAVADAVAAQPLGADLLRQTILNVADLRGATVNYAHEVLALLLCEGAATILETNYDDCIERGAHPERPTVVRTATELLHSTGAVLLKAHGCATQPETMLVTRAELDSAPRWAQTRFAAQLGNDRVAFIGIGSPANYVRNSVSALMADVGVEHLLLVDPFLANWDDEPRLAWRELLPALHADQRDTRSAAEFCDALMRAYLAHPRTAARQAVAGMTEGHPQRLGLESVLQALEVRDAVWVMRWLREASYKLATGASVATSSQAVAGLLAIGALVAGTERVRVARDGWLLASQGPDRQGNGSPVSAEEEVNEVRGEQQEPEGADQLPAIATGPTDVHPVPVMLLLVHGSTIGALAQNEARQRVVRARAIDLIPAGQRVVVVSVRHMGPMSAELSVTRGDRLANILARVEHSESAPPEHVVAVAEAGHQIDGVTAGAIIIMSGDDLIEAA